VKAAIVDANIYRKLAKANVSAPHDMPLSCLFLKDKLCVYIYIYTNIQQIVARAVA
jgi:hypothetical protein